MVQIKVRVGKAPGLGTFTGEYMLLQTKENFLQGFKGVGTVAAITALATTLFDQVINYSPCCHNIARNFNLLC